MLKKRKKKIMLKKRKKKDGPMSEINTEVVESR